MVVHQGGADGGYGQRLLRSGLAGWDSESVEMSVGRSVGRYGHAPFRRVIDRSVSRSPIVTVSFPGRACHPLTKFN